MANPSFVAGQGAKKLAAASSTTLPYPGNNTAGNLLIAVVRCNQALSTPVVSDPNNTWVLLDTETLVSKNQLWYALNCKAGANTVTLNDTSGLSTAIELLIGEYQSGTVGSVLALDAHHATTGASSAPASGNCITAFANDLLIGWQGNDAASAITAGLIGGGAAVIREDQSEVAAYEDNNAANNSAGLNSASFTGSQSSWACGIAAFNAPAVTHSISGNAGIAGATVAWSGTASGSTTADGSGNYTIPSLADGPYTITPSKTGYTFAPTSQNETVAGADITGVNFTATQILVATPTLSPNGGTYASGSVVVTISDTDSGLGGFAMYYTTDGGTPTTGSTLYTGPITVSSSLTLKVLAVATGYANSAIASASYTIRNVTRGSRSK